jgi:hypothetical protein
MTCSSTLVKQSQLKYPLLLSSSEHGMNHIQIMRFRNFHHAQCIASPSAQARIASSCDALMLPRASALGADGTWPHTV